MLKNGIYRKVLTATKRAVLASVLCGLAATSAPGEVVDLPSSPIDRWGNPVQPSAAVRQVQAQVPQPPADVPAPTPLQPAPTENLGQDQLNVNPNANINDLMPPQPPVPPQPPQPPAAQNFNAARQRGLGATASAFSSAPTMMGDFFGGGFTRFGGSQTVNFSGYAPGTIVSGGPGQFGSTIAFEFGPDMVPNDIFTTGTGADIAVDGFADSFAIAEPLPPNDAPLAPGPGFIFDGGTAVYTNNTTSTTPQLGVYNNGQDWFIAYSYTQTLGDPTTGGRPIPGPGVSVRRIKLSENYSPDVRDRWFASYNFFDNSFGGLGDVSRYLLGVERIVVDQLVSVEVRLPMAGTYGSNQSLDLPESRAYEFGNAAFLGKGILLRTESFLWTAGLGVSVPTADDTRISNGGQEVFVVKNRSVHLLPFTGMLLRTSRDTSFQGYMQLDVAANGDPVFGDLRGGNLPQLGVFNDSNLLFLDASVNHVLYRNRCSRCLRQVIANGELHYSGTLQESDLVSRGDLTYTNLKRNFNIVNATMGSHLVFGNNLIVTPAIAVPLRSGLDKQFDYEAIVQLNYLR